MWLAAWSFIRAETMPREFGLLSRSVLLLLCTAASSLSLAPVRDSALPLSNKRILLPMIRAEAARLSGELVLAGARPIWCPTCRAEPLATLESLDDSLVRLAEFDVLVLLCPTAIDTIAERWLSFTDGSKDMVQMMLEASDVEVGVVGTDAQRFRARLGVPVSVAPIEPSARALATTLSDLGHVKPGARVMVAAGRVVESKAVPLEDPPRNVASALDQMLADGATVERVDTHTVVASDPEDMSAELSMLRAGQVDAVCANSAEEIVALISALGDDADALASLPLIVAMGEEVGAAAAALAPDAEVLQLGARLSPEKVVGMLESHFGAGKLLF